MSTPYQASNSNPAHYRGTRELASLVPFIAYLIVNGLALPSFPGTRPSRPAPWVQVTPVKVIPGPLRSLFPIRVNGDQWNDLVIPLLKEYQAHGWVGKILPEPTLLSLFEDLYGPEGSVVFSEGSDWANSPPTQKQPGVLLGVPEYLTEIRLRVLTLGPTLGYGPA